MIFTKRVCFLFYFQGKKLHKFRIAFCHDTFVIEKVHSLY